MYLTLLHLFILPLSFQPHRFSHRFPPYLSLSTSLISTPLTSAGVPDAPRIVLDGDTLSWEAPNDRGSPITGYRITATWVPLCNMIIFLPSFSRLSHHSSFCLQYAKTQRGGLARFCHVNVHLGKQIGRVPTKTTQFTDTLFVLNSKQYNIQNLHTWTDTT